MGEVGTGGRVGESKSESESESVIAVALVCWRVGGLGIVELSLSSS